jgi:hypothetical protein
MSSDANTVRPRAQRIAASGAGGPARSGHASRTSNAITADRASIVAASNAVKPSQDRWAL